VEPTPAGNVKMVAPREVIDQFAYEFYDPANERIRIAEEATK